MRPVTLVDENQAPTGRVGKAMVAVAASVAVFNMSLRLWYVSLLMLGCKNQATRFPASRPFIATAAGAISSRSSCLRLF